MEASLQETVLQNEGLSHPLMLTVCKEPKLATPWLATGQVKLLLGA